MGIIWNWTRGHLCYILTKFLKKKSTFCFCEAELKGNGLINVTEVQQTIIQKLGLQTRAK